MLSLLEEMSNAGAGDIYGQMGNGSTTETNKYPVSVHKSSGDNSALDGITAISLASAFSCALTDGGNVKCWGAGYYGQLGDGTTTTQKTTPVECAHKLPSDSNALSGITAISVGESQHSLRLN